MAAPVLPASPSETFLCVLIRVEAIGTAGQHHHHDCSRRYRLRQLPFLFRFRHVQSERKRTQTGRLWKEINKALPTFIYFLKRQHHFRFARAKGCSLLFRLIIFLFQSPHSRRLRIPFPFNGAPGIKYTPTRLPVCVRRSVVVHFHPCCNMRLRTRAKQLHRHHQNSVRRSAAAHL